MSTFLALYRGPSVSEAKLVAVTADPDLIMDFAGEVLRLPVDPDDEDDPVCRELVDGRRRALHVIAGGHAHG